jgi:hypothetical protein
MIFKVRACIYIYIYTYIHTYTHMVFRCFNNQLTLTTWRSQASMRFLLKKKWKNEEGEDEEGMVFLPFYYRF